MDERTPAAHVERLIKIDQKTTEDFVRLSAQLHDQHKAIEHVRVDLSRAIHSNTTAIFIIRDAAKHIQSSVTANLCPTISGYHGRIDNVVTDASHRKKGFATLLLNSAEVWLQGEGATSVDLSSKPEPGTRDFYKKRGYIERDSKLLRKIIDTQHTAAEQ